MQKGGVGGKTIQPGATSCPRSAWARRSRTLCVLPSARDSDAEGRCRRQNNPARGILVPTLRVGTALSHALRAALGSNATQSVEAVRPHAERGNEERPDLRQPEDQG